jgi:hypothetical protein
MSDSTILAVDAAGLFAGLVGDTTGFDVADLVGVASTIRRPSTRSPCTRWGEVGSK